MKIYGLQKMTLLDFPGHVACTVFLGGCDLRCPFCHNYELATLHACTGTCRRSSGRSARRDSP